VLPMFEGVGGSSPYMWVNPPPQFAAGNIKPHVNSQEVPLQANGSPRIGLNSGDGQFNLNLVEGSIAARAGDAKASVTFTPLDPATLGPVPSGMRADGNAYHVEMKYLPSATDVTTLAKAGNAGITLPEPSIALLYSPDGRLWQKVDSEQ